MKINGSIEEYDVRNLQEIYSTAESVYKKCVWLNRGATMMEHNITVAERGFTSENMARAKEVIKKYIRMLEDAGVELKELSDSANEFAEKLRNTWRPW